MSGTFHPFVGQIKGKLGRAIAFVRDEKDATPGLFFKIAPEIVHGLRKCAPAAETICRITSVAAYSDAADHHHNQSSAHEQSEQKGSAHPISSPLAGGGTFAPVRDRENGEAKIGESVPVGSSGLVDREQGVKNENRQPKPEQIEHLEALLSPPPAPDCRPGKPEK